MTGEPTHTASKERNGAAGPSYINYRLKSEVSIICKGIAKGDSDGSAVADLKGVSESWYS